MSVTQKEYEVIANKQSQNSPMWKNMILAFVIGGAICTLGQLLFHLYTMLGIEMLNARSLVSVTLVFLSAFFTALKLYNKLARFGGAGTLVPITGFANAVVSPAMEFKSEGHVLGIGSKMFIIAGPVIVFGVIASVIYGVILWLFRLI